MLNTDSKHDQEYKTNSTVQLAIGLENAKI